MPNILLTDTQIIDQLEARRGGYFYLKIYASFVNSLEKGKHTRLICQLDTLEFQCGLNHMGDGNYFIIISKKNMDRVGKSKGDSIAFELRLDPNPLGVAIPEVLEVLLEQDDDLKEQWDSLTDGKKRGTIHAINRIKNIDLQVSRAIELIGAAVKK